MKYWRLCFWFFKLKTQRWVQCFQLQIRRIFFISFLLQTFHFSGFQFVLPKNSWQPQTIPPSFSVFDKVAAFQAFCKYFEPINSVFRFNQWASPFRSSLGTSLHTVQFLGQVRGSSCSPSSGTSQTGPSRSVLWKKPSIFHGFLDWEQVGMSMRIARFPDR